MEITVKKPFLLWRDDWQLGHDCLDEQHVELANILNKLHHFVVYDDTKPRNRKIRISQQLTSLVEIARRHFKTEEALMRAHDYPRLGDHHREHVTLLAELQEWVREIETGSKPFTLETLTALKHWQIDHAIYSDRLFTDYLKEQSHSGDENDIGDMSGAHVQPG
jgi:hemerythrin